jgi:hypothetical protein
MKTVTMPKKSLSEGFTVVTKVPAPRLPVQLAQQLAARSRRMMPRNARSNAKVAVKRGDW